MTGVEPVTSSLPRTRSTTELHRLSLSGKRDSNPRPSAWKADALPAELLPLNVVGVDGLEPSMPEGDRVTVWCNSHYATLPSAATLSVSTNNADPDDIEPAEGLEPPTY